MMTKEPTIWKTVKEALRPLKRFARPDGLKGFFWCVMVTWAESVTSKMADAMRCLWWRAIVKTCNQNVN